MPGVVRTVKLKKGVAVVADSFEQAMAGRNALKGNWKLSQAPGYDSVQGLEQPHEMIHADPNAKVDKIETKGDASGAFAKAAKTFKAEYRSDYGYHAQMEPLNATVRFNEAADRVEVWDGSQAPHDSRKRVADALGLKQDQVVVNQCYMGGGFGRRSLPDYTVEAALIAKEFK